MQAIASPMTSHDIGSNSSVDVRPSLRRQTTDQILFYYQSAGGDNSPTSAQEIIVPSQQHSDSQPLPSPFANSSVEGSPPSLGRRKRLPSAAGADNRRLHIVEVDEDEDGITDDIPLVPGPSNSSRTTSPKGQSSFGEGSSRKKSLSNSLLSRRGHEHSRLALMAPPDAAPSSYMNLTPPDVPQTAPPKRSKYHLGGLYDSDDGDLSELATRDHRRTRSNVVDQGSTPARAVGGGYSAASRRIPAAGRTSPRDGGVNTTTFFPPGDYVQSEPTWKLVHGTPILTTTSPKVLHKKRNDSLTERKFAIPQSSSAMSLNGPSPSATSQASLPPPEPTAHSSSTISLPHSLPHSSSSSSDIVLTPNIGEGKDPSAPVAGPVVVGLGFDLPKAVASANAAHEPSSNRSSTSNPSSGQGSDAVPPPSASAAQQATGIPAGNTTAAVTGPPPPRPPRAAASLRAAAIRPGLTPSQTVPISARPELPKLGSDFSIVAMSVGSSSSSSVPLSVEATSPPTEDTSARQKAHHRREGANAGDSPVMNTKQRLVESTIPESPTAGTDTIRGSSGPSSSPAEHRSPSVFNRSHHVRHGLPSQWSSSSDPPDIPSKAGEPTDQNMEDFVLAVDKTIGGPVSPTQEALPSPPPPPQKDTIDVPGRNSGLRTKSRSPALERVDESDSVYSGGSVRQGTLGGTPRSQPPTPSMESHPSTSFSRPSSSMSGKKGTASVNHTEPVAHIPHTTSMAGIGAGHSRHQRYETEPDLYSSAHHHPYPASNRSTTPPPPPAKNRRLSNGSLSKPLAGIPHVAANLMRSPSSVSTSFRSLRQQTFPFQPHFDLDATPRTSRTNRARRPPGQLPDAFWFKDVLARKTPLERAAGYAEKMRQLFEEDSGLADWITCTKGGGKRRSRSPHSSDTASSLGLARSASRASSSNGGFSFNPKPRNVSHGSEATESTFPLRADAYVATELSSRNHSPPRGPPANLPYPGVIQNMAMRTSATMRSLPTTKSNGSGAATPYSTSMRSLKGTGTGFFSSIGRRASIKKERPGLGSGAGSSGSRNGGNGRPAQVPLPPAILPRPPQLGVGSIVGGPRPLPHRPGAPVRHNSLLEPRSRVSNDGGSNRSSPMMEVMTIDGHELYSNAGGAEEDTSTIGHGTEDFDNSSLRSAPSHVQSDMTGSTSSGADLVPRSSLAYRPIGRAEPASPFNASLEKIADVLPHVDRRILAAYLKRAGGDHLKAMDKYVGDERNGVVDFRM